MENRGVSNIEMVIAFLLFVGFVFAALLFFNPGSSNDRIADSSLSYALSAILKDTSIEVISYSVKINTASFPQGTQTIAVDFPPESMQIPNTYNVYAEDYGGNPIQAERDGQRVYLNVSSLSDSPAFVIIRFSEDFARNTLTDHPDVNHDYYEISSSSTRNVVSEKRIKSLNYSYFTDYTDLKKSLGLPSSVDFGFSLKYPDGYSIVSENKIPQGINVFSTVEIKETITSHSPNYLIYGEVSVQVW